MEENITPNLSCKRHWSPTFQQVYDTIGKWCVAGLLHSERPRIMHCHR